MGIKDVLMIGNPKLRKKSEEVLKKDPQLKEVITDLKDTLFSLQNTKKIGRALAAPQIGHFKKVIYFNSEGREIIMINPKIIYQSAAKFDVWDSCYSFDVSFFIKVKRNRIIKIKYQNEKFETKIEEFSDEMSELFQHEIDHLDGILATDHLTNNRQILMRSEWEKIN